MNKKVLRIVIILIVLAALVGAYFALTTFVKDDGDEESAEDTVAVSQEGVENITAMSYLSDETNGEYISLHKENDVWYYDADNEFPLNQTYVTAMAKSVAQIEADRELEGEIADLSEYGFDNPLVTVKVEYKDGTNKTVYVGNYNESTENYYLKTEEPDTIYRVDGSIKLNFEMGLYDIV